MQQPQQGKSNGLPGNPCLLHVPCPTYLPSNLPVKGPVALLQTLPECVNVLLRLKHQHIGKLAVPKRVPEAQRQHAVAVVAQPVPRSCGRQAGNAVQAAGQAGQARDKELCHAQCACCVCACCPCWPSAGLLLGSRSPPPLRLRGGRSLGGYDSLLLSTTLCHLSRPAPQSITHGTGLAVSQGPCAA